MQLLKDIKNGLRYAALYIKLLLLYIGSDNAKAVSLLSELNSVINAYTDVVSTFPTTVFNSTGKTWPKNTLSQISFILGNLPLFVFLFADPFKDARDKLNQCNARWGVS